MTLAGIVDSKKTFFMLSPKAGLNRCMLDYVINQSSGRL